jgi:pimeloyl-ACP methyl ester carboxylesterase
MDIGEDRTARRLVPAAELTFEVLEHGEGDLLALCLHGFPSQAICWREQLPLLASLGYRAWAPSLRGYGWTSRPERVADYTIDKLLGDIAALIDASGARSVVLIGHDWGGLLAWFFAARRIRPLEKLIILNAPHPAIAAVAYRKWRQMRKAWYMLAFQVPWLPDFLLRFNQAWLLGRLMRFAAGGRKIFPADVLDAYRSAAAEPGAVTAMLNWYRALVRTTSPPPEVSGRCPIIDTPTLVIWGEADVALDLACLDGLEDYVSDLRVERLPGVSHWVQEEAPEAVNGLIARFAPTVSERLTTTPSISG